VGGDFLVGGGFAEARDVGVGGHAMACPYWRTPGVIGAGDSGDFFVGEFAVLAVHESAHFAGVNKERLAATVTKSSVSLVPSQKPETDGNLRDVKKLARKRDHAIDKVGLDDGFADFAFSRLIGGHRAIGEDKSGDAVGREVMDEVLDPGEVGVAGRRHTKLPANVFFEAFTAPIAVIERRIGEEEIGFEVLVRVIVERALAVPGDVGLDATNGEVHLAEPPGGLIGFLAVDAEVGAASAVGFDEFFGLHEHAARPATRVKDAAFVRLDHFDEELDDRLRCVEFAAFFAFAGGELAEEVFVDAAENVARAAFLVAEADGADEVDELAEAALIEGFTGVVLGEDALEGGILFFDGEHGVVEELADAGLLGGGLQLRPAGGFGNPEDVFGGVFVTVFGVSVRLGGESGVALLEGVRNVFEEDEAEDDVLVVGGVHIAAQLVGGLPKSLFEAKIRTVFCGFGLRLLGARHAAVSGSSNGWVKGDNVSALVTCQGRGERVRESPHARAGRGMRRTKVGNLGLHWRLSMSELKPASGGQAPSP